MLTDAEKEFLLKVARCSMESAVRGTEAPTFETAPETLMQPAGCFVTLHVDDELRGCIGYIDPVKPLVETVREVAAKAALDDLRFSPVELDELADIWIEISVLSPIHPISSIEEITLGTHGVVVEFGRFRGLLLPRVATDNAWDRETFLCQTARKAGLPPMAWKDPGANTFTFTAEVFSERSIVNGRRA